VGAEIQKARGLSERLWLYNTVQYNSEQCVFNVQ